MTYKSFLILYNPTIHYILRMLVFPYYLAWNTHSRTISYNIFCKTEPAPITVSLPI